VKEIEQIVGVASVALGVEEAVVTAVTVWVGVRVAVSGVPVRVGEGVAGVLVGGVVLVGEGVVRVGEGDGDDEAIAVGVGDGLIHGLA
jgi:hypothetical protein